MNKMRADPKQLSKGQHSLDVEARFDAPPQVRRARWILSQLWPTLFPLLPVAEASSPSGLL
jgi:hypothetical protein